MSSDGGTNLEDETSELGAMDEEGDVENELDAAFEEAKKERSNLKSRYINSWTVKRNEGFARAASIAHEAMFGESVYSVEEQMFNDRACIGQATEGQEGRGWNDFKSDLTRSGLSKDCLYKSN